MMSVATLRRRLLRNPYWRLTLKAKAAGMPLFWWRRWARALWLTRQWPRLRRAGMVRLVRMAQRDVAAKTLDVFVESARRRQRFGSETEASRSIARSHNARIQRRLDDAQETLAEIHEAILRFGEAG